MRPLAPARTRACLVDGAGYLGLAAALVPLGLVLHPRGRPSRASLLALSALPPVAATLLAARQEATGGTPGHRRAGMVVVTADGSPPGPGRALLRNALKTGLPWQLGHVVALGAAAGGFERRDPQLLAATELVYPWLAVAAVAVATGTGRGLHDRAAGTTVVAVGPLTSRRADPPR